MITEPAPAKINLALHIRARRPDGYHDIETLFAFARDGDVVTIAPATEDSFEITGPFAAGLAGDNLVLRARDAFRASFGAPPVAITLEKNLPVASGIGGGSADAAATLRALCWLIDVPLWEPALERIARTLGADVPACFYGLTQLATGRGDELRPLAPLGDLPFLLVNPLVPLSTAAMFAAWDGVDRGPIARVGTALERAGPGGNDFTAPAIAAAPVVADVLMHIARAEGCTFARMSGSGASCFGIFADEAMRDAAATGARQRGWWALATRVR